MLISYELKQQESAVSIISYIVKNVAYYIVGTAVVLPFQEEPVDGRLLAFQLNNGRLELLHVVQVPGAVYSLKSFNELILCSINATIALYSIDLDNGFKEVGSYSGSVLSLMLKTKGDFVIVGDLMKSVTLLNYQKDKPEKFVEIAQDFECKWMLALEFIDDDSFLCCENFCNLFTLIKNPDVSSEAEQNKLVQFGQFYLGESVNVFTHGSLVMDTAESRPDFIQGKSIIFGGVSGSVGLVIPISEDAYNILMAAQTRFLASDYTTSVGNIEHADWRAYRNLVIKKTPQNFIDGDVVEILLELPRLDMTNLISDVEIKDHKGGVRAVSPEEVFRIIEELARLH